MVPEEFLNDGQLQEGGNDLQPARKLPAVTIGWPGPSTASGIINADVKFQATNSADRLSRPDPNRASDRRD